MSRVPLVVGNWKMHHGGRSGVELAERVALLAHGIPGCEVVVAPPFTSLAAVAHTVDEIARRMRQIAIGVGAQNVHFEQRGAFTGEVSTEMLLEAGVSWVIVGHSERRSYSRETDEEIRAKTHAVLSAGLRPIICVGETLPEREAGETLEVVLRQLEAVVSLVVASDGRATVAYEPVWAIGTGRVANPADAQEVHTAIRARLAKVDSDVAWRTRLLYGGSVKASNAHALMSQPDVDGALVGGAALDVNEFGAILRAAATAT